MVHGFMTFYSVSQEEVRHSPIKEQARKSVQGFTRSPTEMERTYQMRDTRLGSVSELI